MFKTKRPALGERAGRIKTILRKLDHAYAGAQCALVHSNPLELLIATILSAQCTDERVNKVTPELFKKYRAANDYAASLPGELEEEIRPTGFFRNKAKMIRDCTREMVTRFDGNVPKTLEDLVSLPGIGRKTANVVLGTAFGVPGITVDTHVLRVSQRLDLTGNQDPVKVEFDLMEVIPKDQWVVFSHLLIFHGRYLCKARKPLCEKCTLQKLCNYFQEQLPLG